MKVVEDKERLINCHNLKENIETWQLNAMWNLGLDSESEKKAIEKLVRYNQTEGLTNNTYKC